MERAHGKILYETGDRRNAAPFALELREYRVARQNKQNVHDFGEVFRGHLLHTGDAFQDGADSRAAALVALANGALELRVHGTGGENVRHGLPDGMPEFTKDLGEALQGNVR